jgi:hypothetical protein
MDPDVNASLAVATAATVVARDAIANAAAARDKAVAAQAAAAKEAAQALGAADQPHFSKCPCGHVHLCPRAPANPAAL